MKPPIAFMFSGQGSQYYHMSKPLFEGDELFRKHFMQIDRLHLDLTGVSIIEIIFSSKKSISDDFSEITLTHPAIFMLEYALAQALIDNGIKPQAVLGASLGEFTAAVFAGVLDPEPALSAVISQAKALEATSKGGMISILQGIDFYENQAFLNQNSEIAAINFPSNIVVAAKGDKIDEIMSWLRENGITYQILPVLHAYHSSLIDSAKSPFLESISKLKLRSPSIPYVSCVGAHDLKGDINLTHLWDIARCPILLQNSIQFMNEKLNIETFIDVGPSGTLATSAKQILGKQKKIVTILSPFNKASTDLKTLLSKIS